ncbi:alpha/beta hydrolase family protein [Providencia manganoxydans]
MVKNMKKCAIFLMLTTFSLTTFANNTFDLQKINNKSGKEIHYYIIKRDVQPSDDLLVLIQGSDCRSVVNNDSMIKNFGGAFPKNDILLVEKTGLNSQVGKDGKEVSAKDCPIDYMKNDSPLERAENYLALIEYLKNNYHNIVIIGGSEGAVVTNLIISKTDKVQASVSLNMGGQFFINDVIYSIEKTTPTAEIPQYIDGFKQFAKEVVQNKLDEDQFPSEHGGKWWREMLTINNQKLIRSVKTPHLVIQTMDDINVDPYSVVRMMEKSNNQHVYFKTYQGLDHFFVDNKGQGQTELIVKDIQLWYQTVDKK